MTTITKLAITMLAMTMLAGCIGPPPADGGPSPADDALCHGPDAFDALQEGRKERRHNAGASLHTYSDDSDSHRYRQVLATDNPTGGTLLIAWTDDDGTAQINEILCRAIFPNIQSQVFYNEQAQREQTFIEIRIVTKDYIDICPPSASTWETCLIQIYFRFFPDDTDFYWAAFKEVSLPRMEAST